MLDCHMGTAVCVWGCVCVCGDVSAYLDPFLATSAYFFRVVIRVVFWQESGDTKHITIQGQRYIYIVIYCSTIGITVY